MKKIHKMIVTAAALASAASLPMTASAQTLLNLDGTTTAGATVDRYAPNSFTSTTIGGQSVLDLNINSAQGIQNRPAPYQSGFYNTQGENWSFTDPNPGAWTANVDLYITSGMLAGTAGPMSDEVWLGTGNNNGYYVMGFSSGVSQRDSTLATPTTSSMLEVYNDVAGTWNYYGIGDLSLGFNQFTISYDGAGNVNYYDNGHLLESQGSLITIGTDVDHPSNLYLEGVNYYGNGNGLANSGSYDADWNGGSVAVVPTPEPSAVALASLGGIGMLVAIKRKYKHSKMS